MEEDNVQPMTDPLTDRELEIVRLIAEGLSDRQIAQELFVSLGTVKWYNKQIYGKLGVHSRTQAVAKAREAGLLDEQPAMPVRSAAAPRHNLPAPVTSFVGREREIAEVRQLLKTARLLTLTGPGGSGKTRLALRVAEEVIGHYADGVFFVDLAPIIDPQLVASSIAQVLGVREAAGRPLIDTLTHHLREKDLLLVLDNFEQIVDAAPLIGDLLSASPGLKVLVTSREALRIYGEQEYLVPPLALPDLVRAEPVTMLSHYEAIELFAQRARAVRPDFVLTANSAPAIAEICVRLDGLPLAIELAAARSRLLPPEMMRTRLESRLGTLTSGSRDLPARMQTLRGAIEWSYNLLDEDEKVLFARLSVFQGGCTVEAAEAVCTPGLSLDALDGLDSLRNKNLLRQEESPKGEPRFLMLETIHEYAREKLGASGESEDLRRRHAEYFVALAEQAEPELRGARQGLWSARLRVEHDNLRSALAWTLADTANSKTELGLRLVGALSEFWYYEGRISESEKWIEQAIMRVDQVPPGIRAKVLNGAGMLAFARGDHKRGRRWNGEALAVAREVQDKSNWAWALFWLSAHATTNPDEYQEGIALCEEALSLFREIDDKPGLAWGYNQMGELTRLVKDYARARSAYEESITVCRETGNRRREAIALVNLSYVAQHQGDYRQAEMFALEGLTLLHDLELEYHSAIALSMLAGPVTAQGKARRAAKLLGASEAAFAKMSVGLQPADRLEIDRYIFMIREQLGDEEFRTAWAEGRSMSIEQAIAYALGEEAG